MKQRTAVPYGETRERDRCASAYDPRSLEGRPQWLGAAARALRVRLGAAASAWLDARTRLAAQYLRGDGVEIGALASPLRLPRSARVTYVDRLTVEEMHSHYPELADVALVPPDIVDNGEVLTSIRDGSLGFIAASHFIEHCENPIGTIENHLRKLRPGGILFLVVPDKRATFDAPRAVTSLEHAIRDYEEGPGWSRRSHFEEWVREVNGMTEGADEAVERLLAQRYSIHFHAWTPRAFLALLDHCSDVLGFPFELEAFERAGPEFFVVLAKREG